MEPVPGTHSNPWSLSLESSLSLGRIWGALQPVIGGGMEEKRPPSFRRRPKEKPGRQSEDDRTPRGIIRISSVGLSGDPEELNNDASENEQCNRLTRFERTV